MITSIPELFRKQAIDSLFETETFKNCWRIWQPEIRRILGDPFSENDLINLGDHLSDIFRTTGGAGRGQGELSAGGTAWESLVCWYINLCSIGSRIVAIKKMSQVPKPIQDSITINYGNFACNTESDITIIIFPNSDDYNSAASDLVIRNSRGVPIPATKGAKLNNELMDFLTARDFIQYEIGIIQCKTNWNDNAQVPMLWDMIYSAGGFRGRNITIGRNNFSIQIVKSFTYSFVTVPSNQNTVYHPISVCVKRVTHLSGGNYWGTRTVPNVARSLKEIFTNNFSRGFRNSIRDDIRSALPQLLNGGDLWYFSLNTDRATHML